MGVSANKCVLLVKQSKSNKPGVDKAKGFETLTVAVRSQSLAKSIIQDGISILRDIFCGSIRSIKELASAPRAKGNSVARETVTISPCPLSHIGRKTFQEALDISEQGPMATL